MDNLLRHVLAHLVAKYADETLEIKCLPGGYLDVDTLLVDQAPYGSTEQALAASSTAALSMGDSKLRLVRASSARGLCLVRASSEWGNQYQGFAGPGPGLVFRCTGDSVTFTNIDTAVADEIAITYWNLT